MIFVFGSNLKGIHGAGAARYALDFCRAKWGQGEGLQGESYAIPTCSEPGLPLPLEAIQKHVEKFLEAASYYPTNLQYQVTRIGCGLAGYEDHQIAPMFCAAPDNVWLPAAWFRWLCWKGDL